MYLEALGLTERPLQPLLKMTAPRDVADIPETVDAPEREDVIASIEAAIVGSLAPAPVAPQVRRISRRAPLIASSMRRKPIVRATEKRGNAGAANVLGTSRAARLIRPARNRRVG